ncbi:MAG: ribosome maturation factor RimM [Bacteroidota bacterium]
MKIDDCYYVGVIRKTHGIYGEVRVYFDVDDIYEYQDMESTYLHQRGKLIPFFIDTIRIQGPGMALVRFRDITSRDNAEGLLGCELYLPLDLLPALEGDQFYYHEIVGYTVRDEVRGDLGPALRVEEMPGHDLLVIDWHGREALIPITRDFIHYADHENRRLIARIPEGLLEIYSADDGED